MATRDSKAPDLQRSLTLLWSERPQGQCGPRSRLSVERIAQAAVQVADAEGIDFVYRVCAFLPAIGLLAWFLPKLGREQGG